MCVCVCAAGSLFFCYSVPGVLYCLTIILLRKRERADCFTLIVLCTSVVSVPSAGCHGMVCGMCPFSRVPVLGLWSVSLQQGVTAWSVVCVPLAGYHGLVCGLCPFSRVPRLGLWSVFLQQGATAWSVDLRFFSRVPGLGLWSVALQQGATAWSVVCVPLAGCHGLVCGLCSFSRVPRLDPWSVMWYCTVILIDFMLPSAEF